MKTINNLYSKNRGIRRKKIEKRNQNFSELKERFFLQNEDVSDVFYV